MKYFAAAVLALLIFSLPAPAQEAQTQAQTQTQTQTAPAEVIVTYDVILEGTYSGLKEPLAKVIADETEWKGVWKKHVSMLVPQPPIPQIDFSASVLVVIASGEKTTGGYRIVLKSVEQKEGNIEVTYRETVPPPNSLTLQVLTQPFLFLRVTRPPQGSVTLVKK